VGDEHNGRENDPADDGRHADQFEKFRELSNPSVRLLSHL
jgi:hypothetical protein